jgi:hypothetical protein
MSLKVLHKHIFAAKLRELLARSEILCVYQALSGDVSAAALAADANAKLPADLGFRAEACRMRNAVAAATGNPLMQTLFHTSNVLVGFAPSSGGDGGAGSGGAAAGAATTPTTADSATAASTSIREMLSGLLPGGGSGSGVDDGEGRRRAPRHHQHLPQAAVAALLSCALDLPEGKPLALLGAFYRRRPLPLADMRAWRGLDASQVHSELVRCLAGSSGGELLEPLQALMDGLVGAVDAGEGPAGGVVAALEYRKVAEGGAV